MLAFSYHRVPWTQEGNTHSFVSPIKRAVVSPALLKGKVIPLQDRCGPEGG